METICVNILLLDEQGIERSETQKFLKQWVKPSFRIWRCNCGAEALNFLEERNDEIDIIVLDLSINPKEVYNKIYEAAEDTPIIVITNQKDHALAYEVTARGAADVIIRERFEAFPQRLLDAIELSMIRSQHIHDLKKRYAGEVDHHKRVLHWMMGGYSVESAIGATAGAAIAK